MLVININLTGTSQRVCNELTEAATDTPETEIRKAIATYFAENTEPEDQVSLIISATISL